MEPCLLVWPKQMSKPLACLLLAAKSGVAPTAHGSHQEGPRGLGRRGTRASFLEVPRDLSGGAPTLLCDTSEPTTFTIYLLKYILNTYYVQDTGSVLKYVSNGSTKAPQTRVLLEFIWGVFGGGEENGTKHR